MGYAELIDLLEKLPPERQAEVVDFAEFLAARQELEVREAQSRRAGLLELMAHPLPVIRPATPFNRDELYDRKCLR